MQHQIRLPFNDVREINVGPLRINRGWEDFELIIDNNGIQVDLGKKFRRLSFSLTRSNMEDRIHYWSNANKGYSTTVSNRPTVIRRRVKKLNKRQIKKLNRGKGW